MTVTLTDTAPPSTAELLTGVLLGPEHRREHGFWQRLISTEPFRRPAGGTPEERLELAYDRLRILNLSLDSGARLASDPRALAALHAWLGPVDPALTTVAGIHYNLFLGSLLDHECAGRRDLSDYLTMRRIGTFLCTEVAHGNNAAAMETTATYDRERDGFVLHTPNPGAQKFMPNTEPGGRGEVRPGRRPPGRRRCRPRRTPLPGAAHRRDAAAAGHPGAAAAGPDGQPGGPLPHLVRPALRRAGRPAGIGREGGRARASSGPARETGGGASSPRSGGSPPAGSR